MAEAAPTPGVREDDHEIAEQDEYPAEVEWIVGKSVGWHPAPTGDEDPPDPMGATVRGSYVEEDADDPDVEVRLIIEVSEGDGENRIIDTARRRVEVIP